MQRIFSNGPTKDFVRNPFSTLLREGMSLQLAAPYFTSADEIVEAASAGKEIKLLIGLNSATHPDAVAKVQKSTNIIVRYLTDRFHAKLFMSEDLVILGSANLTKGGLEGNREAVILLDRPEDLEAADQARAVFQDLWESASPLTETALDRFRATWQATREKGPSRDDQISDAVGRVEPHTVLVGSGEKSKERLFLDNLRRQVEEQYRPAFAEVESVLSDKGLRREDLKNLTLSNEANRFLNWIRQVHATGSDTWNDAPLRNSPERIGLIETLAHEWVDATDNKVPPSFFVWLENIERVFGSREKLSQANQADITTGLMSLHAFNEQLRHVRGGEKALPLAFWEANGNDFSRVRNSLDYFLFGGGDFVERLHDLLYDSRWKLKFIGRFTAMELFGTVRPEKCPPINGRMAKVLKYLGYDVVAT